MKLIILVSLLVFVNVGPCRGDTNVTGIPSNSSDTGGGGAGGAGGGADGGTGVPAVVELTLPHDFETKPSETTTMMFAMSTIRTSTVPPGFFNVTNTFSRGCSRNSGMYGRNCRNRCYCDPPICDDEGYCTVEGGCAPMRFGYLCKEVNLANLEPPATSLLVDGKLETCLASASEETIKLRYLSPIRYIRLDTNSDSSSNVFDSLTFSVSGKVSQNEPVPATAPETITTTFKPPERPQPMEPVTFQLPNISVSSTPTRYTTTGYTQMTKSMDTTTPALSAGDNTTVQNADAGRRRRDADVTANDTKEVTTESFSKGNVTESRATQLSSSTPVARTLTTIAQTLPISQGQPMKEPSQNCPEQENKDNVELLEIPQRKQISGNTLNIYFDRPIAVKSLVIKGDNLESLCELYISGGIDFAHTGNFFKSQGGYLVPVALHDRILPAGEKKGKMCEGDFTGINFPEIIFETNSSFVLNHVVVEMDWSVKPDTNTGKVTVETEDKSLRWTTEVCYGHMAFLGEPHDMESINGLVIKGDSSLPPVCKVFIFGTCGTGFYGRDCEKRCSESCSADGCDPVTGACKTCAIGFYGTSCEMNCPDGCKAGTGCHAVTGFCTDGCKAGKFPTTTCDQGCSAGCAGDGSCDEVTNECKRGCKPGYYTKTCDEECKCPGDGSCDQESGACPGGCAPGFFGSDCNQKCPAECENGCQPVSGVCLGCPPGKAGDLCQETCTNCAGDGRCDQIDRSCISGCLPGFKGPHCTEEEKPESYVMVTVIVAVGLVLLVVIVVAGAYSMKKKPEGSKPGQTGSASDGFNSLRDAAASSSPPVTAMASKTRTPTNNIVVDEYGTLV